MVIYFSLLLSHWWECFPYDRIASIKSDSSVRQLFLHFSASFPVVLGDFGCDVTCQACRENSPIALGSKPPLVIRIARTCLDTRLQFSLFSETTYPRDHHSRTLIFSHFKPIFFFFRISAQRARSTEHLKLKWMDRPYNIKTTSSSLTMLFGGNV